VTGFDGRLRDGVLQAERKTTCGKPQHLGRTGSGPNTYTVGDFSGMGVNLAT
jgi:hypothetical protein